MASQGKSTNQRGRLEQWLSNPGCDVNAASAILDVRLREVALSINTDRQATGKTAAHVPTDSFPEMARHLGQTFEATLFDGEPVLAAQLLVDAGILNRDTQVKLATRNSGGTSQEYIEESVKTLKKIAKSASDVSWLCNGFRIPAEVLPPDSHFEIDVLVGIPDSDGKHRLVVGEAKVYPDKAGRTPREKLANTRAQAGLYVYILTNWLESLKAQHPELQSLSVDPRGILFFGDVVDNSPKVLEFNSLAFQWQRSAVASESIRKLYTAAVAAGLVESASETAKIEHLKSLDHKFAESCWSGCAMAETCFQMEVDQGSAIVLGDMADKQLAGLPLPRVTKILDDDISNLSDVEEDLIQRFADSTFPEIEGLRWR